MPSSQCCDHGVIWPYMPSVGDIMLHPVYVNFNFTGLDASARATLRINWHAAATLIYDVKGCTEIA